MDNPAALFEVAPAPHLQSKSLSTSGMMREVHLALLPVIVLAGFRFGPPALLRLTFGMGCCVLLEWMLMGLRGRSRAVLDGSAALSGVLLVLTLPPQVPYYVVGIGSLATIALGKAIFGGLGQNLFNPAMVGRAFVTAAFPAELSAVACMPDGISGATPLTALKMEGISSALSELFLGNCHGSMGELSAAACLLGGGYLILRKAASWQIPFALLFTSGLLAVFTRGVSLSSSWSWVHELSAGGLLFGSFFIATDPVTSPVSHRGRLLFGFGVAVFTWFFRSFSSYPEGFMFSILFMNAITPLINQLHVATPVGGAPS